MIRSAPSPDDVWDGPKSLCSDELLLVLVLVLLRDPVLAVLVDREKDAGDEECIGARGLLQNCLWSVTVCTLSFLCWVV